jgi:hypothetical protein
VALRPGIRGTRRSVGGSWFPPRIPQASSEFPRDPRYTFFTLNNQNDPTLNQLLGIDNQGVIAGYFGSGSVDPGGGAGQFHAEKPSVIVTGS